MGEYSPDLLAVTGRRSFFSSKGATWKNGLVAWAFALALKIMRPFLLGKTAVLLTMAAEKAADRSPDWNVARSSMEAKSRE